jgi:hypothetical protein
LKVLQLDYKDLLMLFDLLDEDGSGTISTEKFFRGCGRLRGLATSADLHHLFIDFCRQTTWAENLVESHQEMNDRLAGLLMDIEGLERDVVKAGHDDEDPVLMNRRERYRRQVRMDNRTWHNRDDGSEYSEMYEPSREPSEAAYHHGPVDHFDSEAPMSLVRSNLHKTFGESGIDMNAIRQAHGHAPQQTFAQQYNEESEHFKEEHKAPQHPWETGIVQRKERRLSISAIKPGVISAHERSISKD